MNKNYLKVAFIGCVDSSEIALKTLLANNYVRVVSVITKKKSRFNTDFCDLSPMCSQHGVPVFYAESDWKNRLQFWFEEHQPDVIFCIGWSFLLPEEILTLVPKGVIGFHPAALPKNRGRHPIIWSLTLGLRETASTFFKMDTQVDNGPIVSQVPLCIDEKDDATSLYQKILNIIPLQINEIVQQFKENRFSPQPQEEEQASYWRKRNQKDGVIDWRMSAHSIYNLVRALTKPYIGAEFKYNEIVVKVWKSEYVNNEQRNAEPGKILHIDERGIIVKAGEDALRLLQIEPDIDVQVGDYL